MRNSIVSPQTKASGKEKIVAFGDLSIQGEGVLKFRGGASENEMSKGKRTLGGNQVRR